MLIRRLRRFVRLRGAMALGVLMSLVVSNAEAVAGDMHDGEEHHESMADALVHRALHGLQLSHLSGEGAPQALDFPAHVPHGPGDHHPSGTDHCFHFHGLGVPQSFSLVFAFNVTSLRSETLGRASSFSPTVLPHPPRA